MTNEQQLKLQAFLDGELPEKEAREVLAWTQRDDDAAALLAELKNTRQALAKSESHLSVPETREFFWSKIEWEIQRQESAPATARDKSVFVLLRGWLFPVATAAALALILMLVHFNAPKTVAEAVADSDMPVVETTLASTGATTFRDASEGTTLVWFSDDTPDNTEKPTSIN